MMDKNTKIKPKKHLGQNFLQDLDILDNISSILDIKGRDILEIWPWYGALTTKLLEKSPKSLVLVEFDIDMVEILNSKLSSEELVVWDVDFSIVNVDILKYKPIYSDYLVIANIPYYITSPILLRFLYEVEHKPTRMVILMQKEVWEKLVSKRSSILSLIIEKKRITRYELSVPKNAFYPIPKVDSMVISFELYDKYSEYSDSIFIDFIKKAFTNPRKKLLNNLKQSGYNIELYKTKLQKLWYSENSRPEELSIDNYINLIFT